MKSPGRHRKRKGSILVLSALMLVVVFAMLANSVDLGYLCVVNTELKRCSDAAAMAATWQLLDERLAGRAVTGAQGPVFDAANSFAGSNPVAGSAPALSLADVEVGYLSDPSDPACVMTFNAPDLYNAVRVHVRRTASQNGSIPLFFARVLGTNSMDMEDQATAAFINNVSGFRFPSSGKNLDILPFALDLDTWNAMLAGVGSDDWSWNPSSETVTAGPDGLLEMNLFPQGTGSPGNRGTVDIGSNNNSTADIARQILYGVSEADLAYHGGTLELDASGQLLLNGDTGISAGVKDELQSIIGQPKVIPLFASVSGPGNNAEYVIVQFVGVRVLEVKLTGSQSSKRVMVQTAPVMSEGVINNPGSTVTSTYVYSPAWLVR